MTFGDPEAEPITIFVRSRGAFAKIIVEGSLGGLLAGVRTLVHTDHARPFPDRWFMRRFDPALRRDSTDL